MRDRNAPRFVYFLRCALPDSPIKIGMSIEADRRLYIYQQWSPYPLELIALMPGGRELEAELHERFAHLRLHHEWFRAAPELLEAISALPAQSKRAA